MTLQITHLFAIVMGLNLILTTPLAAIDSDDEGESVYARSSSSRNNKARSAGPICQSAEGLTKIPKAFAGLFNGQSRGNINGIAKSVSVTPSGGSYNVTLVIGDSTGTQTFTARGVVVAAAGTLILTSSSNSSNVIALDYDDTSVSAISNAATFQSSFKTLLGLNPGGTPARFTGHSI